MLLKYLSACWLAVLLTLASQAQRPNYSEDIASIIYTNCSSCHRPGEIGPMPFTDYQEVKAYGSMIEYVTSIDYMPPWTPNPDYRHFLDERKLTQAEKQLLKDWVANGMPQGDPSKEPPFPSFPKGSQLGTPDLVASWARPYSHQGDNQDQYQIFVLPTNENSDRDIAAIEFRPQNTDIAHHAILALDTSGRARTLDNRNTEYGYEGFGGFGFNALDINWTAWVPGSSSRFFPPGIGKRLYKGADILVQMHYGPTSITQDDSSHVNVFFAKSPVARYISTAPVLTPQHLTNGPFVILPSRIKKFHGQYTVPIDVSVIEVAPHCHLLGTEWEVYGVTPNNDTINIIEIPKWDFNWQGNFVFPKLLKLPAGTIVHAFATYDNTINNPLNPNNPPQTVSWGEGTADEMYLVYFSFVPYLPGDENISLATGLDDNIVDLENRTYPIYPNPNSTGRLNFGFMLEKPSTINISILDMQGRKVMDFGTARNYISGRHKLELDISGLAPANYLVLLEGEGFRLREKLIVLGR